MGRKTIFLISAVLGLSALGAFYFARSPALEESRLPETTSEHKPTNSVCLKDSEYADYTIDTKYAKEIKVPTVPVTISIKDKLSDKASHSFTIDNLTPLLEIRKCGIYFMRAFNSGAPNYNSELWRYDYSGKGFKMMTLSLFKNGKADGTSYSGSFSIDPQEKYIVLERGYLGSPDYAGVIKDLHTLKDVFTLTLDDIKKINPSVEPGIIGLGKWSDDGTLVWGTVFNGPIDTAYLRVDTASWKTDVFSPPPGLSGQQALNTNGYIAYTDFTTFYGIDSIAQQAFEEFRRQGRQKHLYLYNFFTKEKKLLTAVSDPEWHFKLKWISDSQLEYFVPPGERMVSTISKER